MTEDLKEKDVLITGGLGMIGSTVAKKAFELGANVTILDSEMKDTGANIANIKDFKEKIKYVKGDIRDKEVIKRVIKDKDIIFNCAAQVSHMLSMKKPFLDIDINCKGHMNLLEECRKNNDKVNIIFTGTRSQFGVVQEMPITEINQDNPTDIYSTNKLASELYHSIYHNAYGMKTTSLRMTNTYGPRGQTSNPSYSVVNWFIGKAILNEDLTIYSPGSQLRDLNFVDDAVDAMILSSENKNAIGEVFVLGTGEGKSLKVIAEEIVEISDSGKVKMVPWPNERKSIEAGDIIIDYSKIKERIGWTPKTSLREGIKATIDFYKKNFNDYF